jgi:thiol-disulfide isomerase/thioredoxin
VLRGQNSEMSSSRVVALVLAAALGLLSSACSTSGGSEDGSAGMTGTGSIVTVAPADRRDPVDLSGETLDGAALDLADYRGQVVVVNYWASWCGPCRGEAPDLVAAQKRLPSAQFVGLDRNDDPHANALAFTRTFDVPYPSLYDSGGKLLFAFNGAVPPTSLPSTIVLDTAGRVAAVVLGATTTTTLVDLVRDVEAQT